MDVGGVHVSVDNNRSVGTAWRRIKILGLRVCRDIGVESVRGWLAFFFSCKGMVG